MNFNAISKLSVRILGLSSLALFSCIFVALIYKESILPFVYSGGITFVLAVFLYLISTKEDIELEKNEACFSVSLAWIVISLAGTLPYIFSGTIPSFADAIFETISGFTTTGSTILIEIESLPKSILFWRALTHFIGGIGIIVLVIIIMPSLKIGSYNLFSMESSLKDRIMPRIKEVGRNLFFIYLTLTILEIIFLLLGGMNLFESICHSFATIATGGFSTRNDSIMSFSPYIQYVITIFMALGGTNFIILYFLYKRKFKKIKENDEFIFYYFVIAISTIFITAILFIETNRPLEQAFRDGIFQVVSLITTTGFASSDYMLWPTVGWTFMFVLLFFGASTGSTTGGIKMARHFIFIKNIQNTLRSLAHPNSIKQIKFNNKVLSPEDNNSILLFICLYFVAWLIGSLILVFMGIDGATAMSSIATAIGNIGSGIGTVGNASNFNHLPDAAKYIMSFYMLLGRLEIYTLLIIFTPAFWRKA